MMIKPSTHLGKALNDKGETNEPSIISFIEWQIKLLAQCKNKGVAELSEEEKCAILFAGGANYRYDYRSGKVVFEDVGISKRNGKFLIVEGAILGLHFEGK